MWKERHWTRRLIVGNVSLNGISEIRAYLRTNRRPVYFVSPTAFNLLGLDRWMRNLHYVTYFDSFDGTHPRVFVPQSRPYTEFNSIEEICNYLLKDKEVMGFIDERGAGLATFVMFDEETEALCAERGLRVAHPSARLRRRIDSKMVTTRLGNEAGVASVPNVLGKPTNYDELMNLAKGAKLGTDLVVQTPYGDSGRTTFFVGGPDSWHKYAKELVGQELKVMKRINSREVCVEGCITRHGTLVGPFLESLVGYPELTPYRGGWCGNDIYPTVLTPAQRKKAIAMTKALGDRLAAEGYKGFFELDFLVDVDTGGVFLGEINPRISGISPITHVTLGSYADLPLFLFHLLEYLRVDYQIDVDELNRRWERLAGHDVWSQLIIKEPNDEVELLTHTPRTGVWRKDGDGSISYARWAPDWHSLLDESEAFYLRIAGPGDYRYKGADLGILVARGRMQTESGKLNARCRRWIDELRHRFIGKSLRAKQPVDHGPLAFKSYR